MIAYFDNSATTQPCPEAVAACQTMLTECWGNPSSVHRLGIQARDYLVNARRKVAQAMGAEEDRIFFTAGGTEANNWAIFSAMERWVAKSLPTPEPLQTLPQSPFLSQNRVK